MEITDPVQRLEYWMKDTNRFGRLLALVLTEAQDMKSLATQLKEHYAFLAQRCQHRLDHC